MQPIVLVIGVLFGETALVFGHTWFAVFMLLWTITMSLVLRPARSRWD